MAAAFLTAAIVAEVIGTMGTRFSDGFTRPVPTAIALTGVVGAYYLLSLALRHGMRIGVAYAVWAGLGVSAVATIGALFLREPLSPAQIAGLVLVIGGVAALELGGGGTTHSAAADPDPASADTP